MAKKVKAKKKKAAPKKAKGSKKAKVAKKTKKKIVKKAAKKKPSPKKKVAKKVVKKKSSPKKTKKAAPKTSRSAGGKAKKAIAKKTATKKPKPVLATELLKAAAGTVATSTNHTAKTETFKKHVTHLKAGDPAPFFEGVDQNGNRITSLDFPGKNLVLFFYPQDDTETCTIEACNLRDEFRYLSDKNYQVIGVSPDGVESHERFANKYNLPYPLIADTEMKIIKAYDVWGQKQLFGRIYDGLLRTTFVIGFEGIIKSVITEVNAADHAKQITAE